MFEVLIFRILIFKIFSCGDADILSTTAKSPLVKVKGV
jgi:hypothetical protein